MGGGRLGRAELLFIDASFAAERPGWTGVVRAAWGLSLPMNVLGTVLGGRESSQAPHVWPISAGSRGGQLLQATSECLVGPAGIQLLALAPWA